MRGGEEGVTVDCEIVTRSRKGNIKTEKIG